MNKRVNGKSKRTLTRNKNYNGDGNGELTS